jgi:hypothetical protein
MVVAWLASSVGAACAKSTTSAVPVMDPAAATQPSGAEADARAALRAFAKKYGIAGELAPMAATTDRWDDAIDAVEAAVWAAVVLDEKGEQLAAELRQESRAASAARPSSHSPREPSAPPISVGRPEWRRDLAAAAEAFRTYASSHLALVSRRGGPPKPPGDTPQVTAWREARWRMLQGKWLLFDRAVEELVDEVGPRSVPVMELRGMEAILRAGDGAGGADLALRLRQAAPERPSGHLLGILLARDDAERTSAFRALDAIAPQHLVVRLEPAMGVRPTEYADR